MDTIEMKLFLKKNGYSLNHTIGSGAYGTVWRATSNQQTSPCAIKIVDMSRMCAKERKLIENEVEILTSSRHPHIVRVYEVLRTKRFMYIVMEYLKGGDLIDRFEAKQMTELETANIALQLFSALDFLHRHGIAHRDLKLENIVYATLPNEGTQVVKLVDFGFAHRFTLGKKVIQNCGTPYYMSPQVANCEPCNPFQVDIWSVGIILYTLIVGQFPFYGFTRRGVAHMVTKTHPKFSGGQWADCTPQFKDMVASLLRKAEEGRPNASEAMKILQELNCETHLQQVPEYTRKHSFFDNFFKRPFDLILSQ
uniref:Protein kinase domain-containing protein n=1 Tax=Compsopogon caeruleus TaxID=31354 RepID=A0A7S1TB58_9RHOD